MKIKDLLEKLDRFGIVFEDESLVKSRLKDLGYTFKSEIPYIPKKKKEFTVINDNDGNYSFIVKSKTVDSAAHEALLQLGWWIVAE